VSDIYELAVKVVVEWYLMYVLKFL
jgi:hypothetical protein